MSEWEHKSTLLTAARAPQWLSLLPRFASGVAAKGAVTEDTFRTPPSALRPPPFRLKASKAPPSRGACLLRGGGARSLRSQVCIYFHDRLLRGNRTTKTNSFRVDAFDSPNFPRLAEVGVNITTRYDLALRVPRGPFRVHTTMNRNIVVLKLVPG